MMSEVKQFRPAGEFRVLIVDDEPVVADTLAMIFRKAGYAARANYSAEEGLETARTWEPNLAIVDVILPKMNGVDLAILISTEKPRCHIVLFSGRPNADEPMKKSGYTFQILAKPVPPADLLRLAAQLNMPEMPALLAS